MPSPSAIQEGFASLPFVITAGVLWADLATPLTPEEYRRVIGQQVLLHEPLRPEVRAYYLAKRRYSVPPQGGGQGALMLFSSYPRPLATRVPTCRPGGVPTERH